MPALKTTRDEPQTQDALSSAPDSEVVPNEQQALEAPSMLNDIRADEPQSGVSLPAIDSGMEERPQDVSLAAPETSRVNEESQEVDITGEDTHVSSEAASEGILQPQTRAKKKTVTRAMHFSLPEENTTLSSQETASEPVIAPELTGTDIKLHEPFCVRGGNTDSKDPGPVSRVVSPSEPVRTSVSIHTPIHVIIPDLIDISLCVRPFPILILPSLSPLGGNLFHRVVRLSRGRRGCR